MTWQKLATWHEGQGNGAGRVFADAGRLRMEQGGTTLYPIAHVYDGWEPTEDARNLRLVARALALANVLAEVLALYGERAKMTTDMGTGPHYNAAERLAIVEAARLLAEVKGDTVEMLTGDGRR